MDTSLRSWFYILGVLGTSFGLMAMSVSGDVRVTNSYTGWGQAPLAVGDNSESGVRLPTVWVRVTHAELAAADAIAAAEKAAFAAILVPAPIREAQAQIEKAKEASRRVSRVSVRLPYYAFGPDPIGGSK